MDPKDPPRQRPPLLFESPISTCQIFFDMSFCSEAENYNSTFQQQNFQTICDANLLEKNSSVGRPSKKRKITSVLGVHPAKKAKSNDIPPKKKKKRNKKRIQASLTDFF